MVGWTSEFANGQFTSLCGDQLKIHRRYEKPKTSKKKWKKRKLFNATILNQQHSNAFQGKLNVALFHFTFKWIAQIAHSIDSDLITQQGGHLKASHRGSPATGARAPHHCVSHTPPLRKSIEQYQNIPATNWFYPGQFLPPRISAMAAMPTSQFDQILD